MTINLDASRAPMPQAPTRMAQTGGLRGDDRRTHIERINDWVGSAAAVVVPDPQPEYVDVAIMFSDEQFAEVVSLLKPISDAAQMLLDEKAAHDAERSAEDLVERPPPGPTATAADPAPLDPEPAAPLEPVPAAPEPVHQTAG